MNKYYINMNKYEKQDAGQKPEIYGIKKTKKTGKCVNNGKLESDMWDVGSIDGTSCIKNQITPIE